MNLNVLLFGVLVALVCFVTACEKKSDEGTSKSATTHKVKSDATGRCPHDIKQEKCPFCNPKLVESEGFCGEHGVAEALCFQCRPYLKAAFRAKGDWCGKHEAPDSQCVACHPELKEKMKPGSGHGVSPDATSKARPASADTCEHTIAKAKCPFCTPSLVESDGYCKEHDVAEALCVQCRPYLEAAFKAKGDWCADHATPESQCVSCNPNLKNKPKRQG